LVQINVSQLLVSTIAANLQTFSQFELSMISPSGLPSGIGNLTTVGGILPQSMAYMKHQGMVVFLSVGSEDYITTVYLNGTVKDHFSTPLVLDNIAYDYSTKEVIVNAYDTTESKNWVIQWVPPSTVVRLVEVPGIVQVGISTYCPNGHIFFLTLQVDGSENALVRVDVENKKVLPSVMVPDAIEIIMWDYTTATMWAWVASENYAGELVQIDIESGKRVKTIVSYSWLSANGGTATFDVKTKVVYSSLINIQNGQQPTWVVVDTKTGKATTAATSNGFPVNLAIVQ